MNTSTSRMARFKGPCPQYGKARMIDHYAFVKDKMHALKIADQRGWTFENFEK